MTSKPFDFTADELRDVFNIWIDPDAGQVYHNGKPLSGSICYDTGSTNGRKNPRKILHYRRVTVSFPNGARRLCSVARLLILQETGADPYPDEIDHLDENTLNNCYWNLEVVSHSEHEKRKKFRRLRNQLTFAGV